MTSFVHLDYSNQHAGVARVEAAMASARQIKRSFSSTRFVATLLLSAIAAAVMVVAYEVMQSFADGHLMVLWVGMWAVAFAALAAFASTARHAAVSAKVNLDNWSRSVAAKRADQRLWAMAKTDARLMSDLQAVLTRNHAGDDAGDEGLRYVKPASGVGKVAALRGAANVEFIPAYHRLYV